MNITKEQVLESLQKILLPATSANLVNDGRVKQVTITESSIAISLLLFTEEEKFKQAVADTVRHALQKQTQATIEISFDVINRTASEVGIGKVKNIIAVASGKGGVGKSTISVNLAVSLAKKGYRVGLLDADIFGPSIPKMFGAEDEIPESIEVEGKHVIVPLEKFGVKFLSIGFFVKREDALAWRGPMASGALKQLINDADWGELDILFLDTPPGTSDIHLTIFQSLSLTAAIIVSTPQDIALIDAIKAIDLFRKDNINVPILGIVENMSWFTPAELPNNRYYIFGKGGCENLAQGMNINLLGQVPIIQAIREGGDDGIPATSGIDTLMKPMFDKLTTNVLKALEVRNQTMEPTKQLHIKY